MSLLKALTALPYAGNWMLLHVPSMVRYFSFSLHWYRMKQEGTKILGIATLDASKAGAPLCAAL